MKLEWLMNFDVMSLSFICKFPTIFCFCFEPKSSKKRKCGILVSQKTYLVSNFKRCVNIESVLPFCNFKNTYSIFSIFKDIYIEERKVWIWNIFEKNVDGAFSPFVWSVTLQKLRTDDSRRKSDCWIFFGKHGCILWIKPKY